MSTAKELDFFFMRRMLSHDLEWYEAHFQPKSGTDAKPVRGEISPLYARLKGWQVDRIATLLPNLRIVLTLRHPIDRVWSQALYEFGYRARKDLRKVRPVEFLRQVERARNMLSSNYYRTIKIWSKAFGLGAVHIDFFDRLHDDPQAYVNAILKHIGASVPWTVPPKFIKQKVWATNNLVEHERAIPDVVQWYIADRLLEPTEQLNELLEGKVSHWVEEMRTIRGATRPSWRVLRQVNRTILSMPERLTYEAYHLVLDFRLWRRWRRLRKAYASSCNARRVSESPVQRKETRAEL